MAGFESVDRIVEDVLFDTTFKVTNIHFIGEGKLINFSSTTMSEFISTDDTIGNIEDRLHGFVSSALDHAYDKYSALPAGTRVPTPSGVRNGHTFARIKFNLVINGTDIPLVIATWLAVNRDDADGFTVKMPESMM